MIAYPNSHSPYSPPRSKMEFQYSTLVPRASYDDESLCTGYTLRIHKDEELVDLGTLRAQEDWSRHVGPVEFYKGSLGAKFNFVSLALPECLPDRIEIIAYINEVIFLHDDIVEDVSKQRVCFPPSCQALKMCNQY